MTALHILAAPAVYAVGFVFVALGMVGLFRTMRYDWVGRMEVGEAQTLAGRNAAILGIGLGILILASRLP